MISKAKTSGTQVQDDIHLPQLPLDCSFLIQQSSRSLINLTRRMFRKFPLLRRWEQTDDIFQNSMIRLYRALQSCKVESPRHFYNLAAVQIRRELIDLVRKYKAASNFASNHHSDCLDIQISQPDLNYNSEVSIDLEKWTDFHLLAENLPEQEREIVDLLWYQGLNQEEAASLLHISLRTLKRRWQSARIKLHKTLE